MRQKSSLGVTLRYFAYDFQFLNPKSVSSQVSVIMLGFESGVSWEAYRFSILTNPPTGASGDSQMVEVPFQPDWIFDISAARLTLRTIFVQA